MKYVFLLTFFLSSAVYAEKTKIPKKLNVSSVPDVSAANTVDAGVKTITVHGMVCAYCSNSLEKKFKKEQNIKKVDISLENKVIQVFFKKGKSMDDDKLKKLVTASGFNPISVELGTHEQLKAIKEASKQ